MEPLSLALSFSAITGLLGQFQAGRSSEKQHDYSAFLEWLVQHQHEEIKAELEKDHKLAGEIQALLAQDRAQIHKKLNQLNLMVATVASRLDGFAGIAGATNPRSVLSDQAISILRQMRDLGGSRFEASRYGWGYDLSLRLLGAPNSDLVVENTQLIEDDLETLVDLGLLRPDMTSNGDPVYIYTRAAENLLGQIEGGS